MYPLNTVLVGVYPLNTVLVGEYPLNTVLVGAYPLYTVITPYSLNTYLEGPAFQVVAIFSLLLMIWLQSWIEYNNFVFNEAINSYQQGLHIDPPPPNLDNNPAQPDQHKVKLNSVRFIVLVGTICFLVIFVLIPQTTFEKNLQLIAVLA
jgi:hypothetical protein